MKEDHLSLIDESKKAEQSSKESSKVTKDPTEKIDDKYTINATRKSLQLPRRAFHMGGGIAIATIYNLLLTHSQAIYILGTCACIIYILEQVRVNYPEMAQKLAPITRYIFRAEEQLKESAGVPMVMGLLLTILTFPKIIAVIAIYTLAIADPLSAIFGIRFGKHRIVKEKSLEGSAAFAISALIISITCLSMYTQAPLATIWIAGIIGTIGITAFEMIPLKIDDNLTIPLAMAPWMWIICSFLGIGL